MNSTEEERYCYLPIVIRTLHCLLTTLKHSERQINADASFRPRRYPEPRQFHRRKNCIYRPITINHYVRILLLECSVIHCSESDN